MTATTEPGSMPSLYGLDFYWDLSQLLRTDPLWRSMTAHFNYSLTHVFLGPQTSAFFLRFERGEMTEVRRVDAGADSCSDLRLAATVDTWHSVLTGEELFMTAFMLGRLKVDGLRPEIGKDLIAFAYLLEVAQAATARHSKR